MKSESNTICGMGAHKIFIKLIIPHLANVANYAILRMCTHSQALQGLAMARNFFATLTNKQ